MFEERFEFHHREILAFRDPDLADRLQADNERYAIVDLGIPLPLGPNDAEAVRAYARAQTRAELEEQDVEDVANARRLAAVDVHAEYTRVLGHEHMDDLFLQYQRAIERRLVVQAQHGAGFAEWLSRELNLVQIVRERAGLVQPGLRPRSTRVFQYPLERPPYKKRDRGPL